MIQRFQILLVFLLLNTLGCSKTREEVSQNTSSELALEYVMKVVGVVDRSQPLPMVVVLHGLGDRPESFINLFSSLRGPARVVAIRGLAPWGKGYTWFPTMLTKGETPETINSDFKEAGQKLSRTITFLTKKYPTPNAPIVTGYSQGGAMSFIMATQFPEEISVALPVSGFLREEWIPAKAPANAPPIITFHGTVDQKVSFEKTNAAMNHLSKIGYSVQMRPHPGGHHALAPKERVDWLNELQRAIEANH